MIACFNETAAAVLAKRMPGDLLRILRHPDQRATGGEGRVARTLLSLLKTGRTADP